MAVDLAAHVRDFLSPRLPPAARLCVGYSGGLDSSVLLHILADLRGQLGYALAAVHVHHGLAAEADAWAAHCAAQCDRLGVPLSVRRVAVGRHGHGLEAAARAARYQAYRDQAADFIVLAHHRDDQAETLLFRLLRGAGVHGLAAMAAERADPAGRLLRPLLAIPRADLAAYAREHGVAHVDDASNGDLALTRNWLRHTVLPELESRFPASRVVLARTAEQLAESAGLLDDLAAADLARCGDTDGLRLAALATLAPARARNLLRYWLHRQAGVLPGRAWLAEAMAQLLDAGTDRQPELALGEWRLRRRHGLAVLVAPGPETAPERFWQGEPELDLGGRGRLRFEPALGDGLAAGCLAGQAVRVGWRAGGERLRPDCRRPGRTLKNLLREAGIPADQRGQLPLLFVGDRLAWAAGLGVDCACQAGPGAPGWLISWCPPGR
ncbi:tRNA lysidine(34) synthetase TilS [Parasulfuritortus cantonensis]|uniref:tRNA(Ile)-lysidine synthase n=1 Tax=Parasulfuritortus cantonensis TaxID=2528202 RepID=A0A4R1BKZ0_9PROT|nr:tRNA lysidine(34) synthetase TilS [Parasulfuritortus cantonensis]TCJ17908.1 tRNA lysidine(34) synthetase TilS [Parasulfuritortus cantonensis]